MLWVKLMLPLGAMPPLNDDFTLPLVAVQVDPGVATHVSTTYVPAAAVVLLADREAVIGAMPDRATT